MAPHSSVLAWRIPGTGEPGGLPFMGSHRVGYDWSDLAAAASCIWLFVTPWTITCQTLWSFTVSRSLLLPSNYLALCHRFSPCHKPFPASGSFSVSQLFVSGGKSIGASASASVLLVNIQAWFLLGLTNYNTKQKCSWPLCWKGHEQYSWPFGVLLRVLIYHI